MSTKKKSIDTITEMMQKEEVKLAKLKERRAAIDDKIRATELRIKEYEVSLNGSKYDALLSALNGKVSIDDIMKAVKEGDFLSLQEKLESETKLQELE